jgi:DNA polymerase-3 subunit delta'
MVDSAVPVPWLDAEWRSLRGRIAQDRLHHALLLSGPAGIGKRRLAERTAAALLCASADAPCGTCRSCRLLASGTHPDSLRIGPVEGHKQIRIEQIRNELVEFVTRTPSIAARKAVLIEPAEAMNTPTANCLLKSLEEPAAGTHLLLVADAPVRLLATIRSRCEHLRLRPPAWQDGLAWLRAQDVAGAEDLLGAASGCPLRALDLARDGGIEQFDAIARVMQKSLGNEAWLTALVAELAALDLRVVLGWMQVFLADLARALADPQAARLGRARGVYAALADRVGPLHVARSLRAVTDAAREAAGTANPNRQLVIEGLLICWSGLA